MADESGDFLGFRVITPVEIEWQQEEYATTTLGGNIPSVFDYAVRMAMNVALETDPFGDANLAGEIMAHWRVHKRSAFVWPGKFPQLPRHKRVANDLTVRAAAPVGASRIQITGSTTDWKKGRVFHVGANGTRMHLVTGKGIGTVDIDPPLREAAGIGVKLLGTALPKVRYSLGWDSSISVTRGLTVGKALELVEA